jgi:hypothetical protein
MALTGAGLFAAMKAKLPVAQDLAMQEAALKPMCEAIVEYFVANTQVTTSVSVAAGILVAVDPITHLGATTTAGTGTGTGTIS